MKSPNGSAPDEPWWQVRIDDARRPVAALGLWRWRSG